jgi:hypothetical protein
VGDVDPGVSRGRWCARNPLELVFLKHKLLNDPMIKPNSRRRRPLVFLKHKVSTAIDLLLAVAGESELFVAELAH